jgi:heterotetrameric sarcosine oxidase delta subunit
MALMVPCRHCGWRPSTEFTWGGELRDVEASDVESDFAGVVLPRNAAGVQEERWFHLLGCRRWSTVGRDTTTDEVGR